MAVMPLCEFIVLLSCEVRTCDTEEVVNLRAYGCSVVVYSHAI